MFLLGTYALLKASGWWYELQVDLLEGQLEELRPTLSAIARHEYLENTLQPYVKTAHQLQQLHIKGEGLLERLSKTLPPSLAIHELEWKSPAVFLIRGSCLAGTREPEAVLTLWAERLRVDGYGGGTLKLAPDQKSSGVWYFELNSEGVP